MLIFYLKKLLLLSKDPGDAGDSKFYLVFKNWLKYLQLVWWLE